MSYPEKTPSGKHTNNYGKSPCYKWVNQLYKWPCSIAKSSFLMGKSTMAMINSYFDITRVYQSTEGIRGARAEARIQTQLFGILMVHPDFHKLALHIAAIQ
jgi:hypothetical protein